MRILLAANDSANDCGVTSSASARAVERRSIEPELAMHHTPAPFGAGFGQQQRRRTANTNRFCPLRFGGPSRRPKSPAHQMHDEGIGSTFTAVRARRPTNQRQPVRDVASHGLRAGSSSAGPDETTRELPRQPPAACTS
jgi:hypothetical protein